MNITLEMMRYAFTMHGNQKRKYTGNPYTEHLAQVAGIVATVTPSRILNEVLCIAWGHDLIEDTTAEYADIARHFGTVIADGIQLLTDDEEGNRAQRKELARRRLRVAPDYVQNVKVADLISNTASICDHDPAFSRVYLPEAEALLKVLDKAHPALVVLAADTIYGKAEGLTDPT